LFICLFIFIDSDGVEIVVGQESQILPAFIICLDKKQSYEMWTRWHENLSRADAKDTEVTLSLKSSYASGPFIPLNNREIACEDDGESKMAIENDYHSNRKIGKATASNFGGFVSDHLTVELSNDDSSETYQLLDS
jgi:hypothetical protein